MLNARIEEEAEVRGVGAKCVCVCLGVGVKLPNGIQGKIHLEDNISNG